MGPTQANRQASANWVNAERCESGPKTWSSSGYTCSATRAPARMSAACQAAESSRMFDRPPLMMVNSVVTASGRAMGEAPAHRSGRSSGVHPRKKILNVAGQSGECAKIGWSVPAGGCREGMGTGDNPVHQIPASAETVKV